MCTFPDTAERPQQGRSQSRAELTFSPSSGDRTGVLSRVGRWVPQLLKPSTVWLWHRQRAAGEGRARVSPSPLPAIVPSRRGERVRGTAGPVAPGGPGGGGTAGGPGRTRRRPHRQRAGPRRAEARSGGASGRVSGGASGEVSAVLVPVPVPACVPLPAVRRRGAERAVWARRSGRPGLGAGVRGAPGARASQWEPWGRQCLRAVGGSPVGAGCGAVRRSPRGCGRECGQRRRGGRCAQSGNLAGAGL